MSSRSLNKVMLIGNLTRDPELRYTPSGTPVCSFGLATNRSWVPSGSEERQEETEFHSVVAWSKLAELCAQLLTKGRKVYIEGRLQTRSWETSDGEKRVKTEIVAEDMIILDNKKVVTEGEEVKKEEAPAAEVVTETVDESNLPGSTTPSDTVTEENKVEDIMPEEKKEETAAETAPTTEVQPADANATTDDDIDITKIPF